MILNAVSHSEKSFMSINSLIYFLTGSFTTDDRLENPSFYQLDSKAGKC